MLEVTPNAIKHLREASQRHGPEVGPIPRFARQAGQLKLGFALKPQPGDKVVDAGGMELFVAADIVHQLDAAIIDVRREDDGKGFLVLRRQRGTEGRDDTRAAHV